MAWSTPKTNWKATVTDGVYTGDYFNYTDYNRIKNNILYLSQMPEPSISINSMGNDKTVSDPIYAEDINAFERNLDIIARAVGQSYDNYPVFVPNGGTPTFADFNQIESMTLVLYNILSGSSVYAIDLNGLYGVVNGIRAKGTVS